MTAKEKNLWRMAELAVKNGKEEETFRALCENKSDINTLMLYCFYEKINRSKANEILRDSGSTL